MKYLTCLVLLAFPLSILADELPQRKSGLWEMTISMTGQPQVTTIKQCTDEKTNAQMMQMANSMTSQSGAACSKNELKKEGTTYTAMSECKMGETVITSKSVFSGDFNSAYQGTVESKFNPSLMGLTESQTKISAKWLGKCAADQKPGDMIMPNGMKMNINTMAQSVRGPNSNQ
jgi:hypothetical protein